MLIVSCEESEVVASAEDVLANTLNYDLPGVSGYVDDYFYDLSSDGIDANYYYYDSQALDNPQFYFDPLTDRLNFLNFPCYLMSLTQNNLSDFNNSGGVDAGNLITTRRLENNTTKHVEQNVIVQSDIYTNIEKMYWDEENERYFSSTQAVLSESVVYSFTPDAGSDTCPDEYEDGVGGCMCDYINGGCTDADINYGDDDCPDEYEDGIGGCTCDYLAGTCTDSNVSGLGQDPNGDNDLNGDNYNQQDNPDGTESDGVYNDANAYTDIYDELEYKVPYDIQTMGPIEGMIYVDTLEWVRKDSIYYNPNPYSVTHTFTLPKDVISSDSLMWAINADCNENNQRDLEAERYVEDLSGCLANEIFISSPELFDDVGSDGCPDAFEAGGGACQEEENYGPDGCPDAFEDGEGGCICEVGSDGCVPNPNYTDGDPNGDNDINGDNYEEGNDGTEGNGSYNTNEPFVDNDEDLVYDTGFCDRTNSIWDPKEAHLDLEETPDNTRDEGEPYQDRNCNQEYDSGEKRESDGVSQSQCENTFNGIWNTTDEAFSFCDIGNGVWDDIEEECRGDDSSSCNSKELYTLSDRPNSLVVSYADENGNFDINDPIVLNEISLNDDVVDRWGNIYNDLIFTDQITEVQTETVSLIDSIVVVESNPIIEQLDTFSNDYYIAKSTWSDDGVDDYDYHIFKKGDEGYIYKLVHKSYFVPPGFSDNWWFDEDPEDEVFLYSVDGLLRDGERYQTSETVATPLGEYQINESYAVDYEPVTVPMREILGEIVDGSVFCFSDNAICPDCASIDDCSADITFDDCFKVTREKLTILDGYGTEYFEKGITYFVKDYGIVKDEVEFRWSVNPNSEATLTGAYKWEMFENNPASSECQTSNFLQSLVNEKKNVKMNEFDQIDKFNNQPYKKTRTYGLQRILEEQKDK